MARQRPREHVVLACEGPGGVIGGAGDADGHHRDHRARRVEALHRPLEAGPGAIVVLAAEEVRGRHATVAERERGALVGDEPHLVLGAHVLEPRRAALDDEGAVTGAAGGRIDARPHDDPVRADGIGDERLRTAQHPAFAVPPRARPDAGHVAPRRWLGHREGAPARP